MARDTDAPSPGSGRSFALSRPSQSFPTPRTSEPLRVAVNEAGGRTGQCIGRRVAPIAPAPFEPDGIDTLEADDGNRRGAGLCHRRRDRYVGKRQRCERAPDLRRSALNVRAERRAATSARRPRRRSRCFRSMCRSAATNASSSSEPAVVEKALVATVVLGCRPIARCDRVNDRARAAARWRPSR